VQHLLSLTKWPWSAAFDRHLLRRCSVLLPTHRRVDAHRQSDRRAGTALPSLTKILSASCQRSPTKPRQVRGAPLPAVAVAVVHIPRSNPTHARTRLGLSLPPRKPTGSSTTRRRSSGPVAHRPWARRGGRARGSWRAPTRCETPPTPWRPAPTTRALRRPPARPCGVGRIRVADQLSHQRRPRRRGGDRRALPQARPLRPEDFAIPPAVYAAAMSHLPNANHRRASLDDSPTASTSSSSPSETAKTSTLDADVVTRLQPAREGKEAVLAPSMRSVWTHRYLQKFTIKYNFNYVLP
jgi:hypothetical protein